MQKLKRRGFQSKPGTNAKPWGDKELSLVWKPLRTHMAGGQWSRTDGQVEKQGQTEEDLAVCKGDTDSFSTKE